jgi:flagellar basal body-associated protein FliL
MRRKLSILVAMLIAATVAVFTAAPSTAEQRPQVAGSLYVMPGGFLVDLASGQTAMLSVALVLTAESERAWLTGLEQERVRSVITDVVAASPARRLVSAAGRRALAQRLRAAITKAGLPVDEVLIPDLAVN